jgi:TPR repeat protein
LLAAGRKQEAIDVVRLAAASGSVGAKVRLARFGLDAGLSEKESEDLIETAVREASEDDETAHWNLYSASELLLGGCEAEEKYHRIQRHLEKYAKASGDPNATLAVARRFANGTAVAQPDVLAAVEWYYFAMALGCKEAKHELQVLVSDA